MGRPKLRERVTMTVRISPQIADRINKAVTEMQDAGESSLTKGALVERLLISALLQLEEQRRSKRQLILV